MKTTKRGLSILLSVIIVLSLIPAFSSVASAAVITSASGSTYTKSPVLAAKLDKIFAGTANIYNDVNCTIQTNVKLGSSNVPPNDVKFVRCTSSNRVKSGESCFIYANGVYNYLFGDYPGHATDRANSTAYTSYSTLTYNVCTSLKLKVGTYVRTYGSPYGHSYIILAYDSSTLTVLNGNSNGSGLISINTMSWSTVSSSASYGASIEHIVQPNDSYYYSLYPAELSKPKLTVSPGTVNSRTAFSWTASNGASYYELNIIYERHGI